MGGRGGSSGMAGRSSGIINTRGASQQAVSLLERAISDIGTFGSAHISIGQTTDTGLKPRAGNPANKDLEKQLTALGDENGYLVSFDTKTSTSGGGTRQLRYGSSVPNKTQTKDRMMHVYRRQ